MLNTVLVIFTVKCYSLPHNLERRELPGTLDIEPVLPLIILLVVEDAKNGEE